MSLIQDLHNYHNGGSLYHHSAISIASRFCSWGNEKQERYLNLLIQIIAGLLGDKYIELFLYGQIITCDVDPAIIKSFYTATATV